MANIYQKLAAITAELQTVAKNLNVSSGKDKSYKAVSERDIIDAVKPLEAKHGVYSYPCDREILESQVLTTETNYGQKSTFFARIKTVYRFVNVDEPSEFIETVTFAEGIDPQDKGSGKAMTYADKYALMKAYKISTGEDPDQTASVEANYTKPLPNVYGLSPDEERERKDIMDCINTLGVDRRLIDASCHKKYGKTLVGCNNEQLQEVFELLVKKDESQSK